MPMPRNTIEGAWRFVLPEPNSGCWLWSGQRTVEGYGQYSIGHKPVSAHRMIYALERGPIPGGLTLDHLCRVPCCVNPSHLEPVTLRENILRGYGPPAQRRRQTTCINGHALSGDNLYVWDQKGWRQCRACWTERRDKNRDRLRAYWRERARARRNTT